MIPPQGRLPINKEQTENALKLAQSEAYLKQQRIKNFEARSLAERQYITALSEAVSGVQAWLRVSAGAATERLLKTTIQYTQALQDYYETEVNILKVDLARTKSQIAIYEFMLAEGEKNIVRPQ